MPDEPDVTAEGTSSTPDPTPAAAPVSAAPPLPTDRPVENVVGEFTRKLGQLQQRIDTLTQYIAANATAQPPVTRDKPATDEELWELAKQGNREAFDLYMERIAERKVQAGTHQLEGQRIVEAQLQTLAARYPVLNDSSHPLSQHAAAVYQSLLATGAPATRATLLDAVKTAIADRPDLVVALHQQTVPTPRPSATSRARVGQTGTTVQQPTPTTPQVKLSQRQVELAKRMGVKDPAKSLERFHKRQEEGTSSLGAVAIHLSEEE